MKQQPGESSRRQDNSWCLLIQLSVDLAARYSNSTYNITEAQFFSWNENIQGSCDGVAVGERVCKG